jgi:hypothetical protein
MSLLSTANKHHDRDFFLLLQEINSAIWKCKMQILSNSFPKIVGGCLYIYILIYAPLLKEQLMK